MRGRRPLLVARHTTETVSMLLSGRFAGAIKVARELFRERTMAKEELVSCTMVTRCAKA